MPDLPELRSSGRWREYHTYPLAQRGRVVRGWLFDGLTHRQLDNQILGMDPVVTRGYQAMGILHAIGLRGDSRGIYSNLDLDLVIRRLQEAGGYELLLTHLDDSEELFDDSEELTLERLRKLEIEELFEAIKRTSLERRLRIRDQEDSTSTSKIVSYTTNAIRMLSPRRWIEPMDVVIDATLKLHLSGPLIILPTLKYTISNHFQKVG